MQDHKKNFQPFRKSIFSNQNLQMNEKTNHNIKIYFLIALAAALALILTINFLNSSARGIMQNEINVVGSIDESKSQAGINPDDKIETLKTQAILLSTELETKKKEASICESRLNATKGKESEVINKYQDISSKNNNLNEFAAKLEQDYDKCNNKRDIYKEIIANAVRDICCSFGDFRIGSTKNWDISDNSIICSGKNTIACANGITKWDEQLI